MIRRLSRKPDHDSGTNLVIQCAQRAETLLARLEIMRPVIRMKLVIKFRIRRLNPQQVAMRACLAPALVNRRLLLAAAERQPDLSVRPLHNPADTGFDEFREFIRNDFAGLQNHGTVMVVICPERGTDNLLFGNPVPLEVCISRADSAVETVLAADVADLHKTAQTHPRADIPQLHFVGGTEQGGLFLRIRQVKKMFQLRIRHQSTSSISPPPSMRSPS